MQDLHPNSPARPPLLILGSPRSGTTFLSQMVNRFFDVHICRDNGTMLRFHKNAPHYSPLSDDANLRRLIAHLYSDHYFRTRLRARGLTLSEEELFTRVTSRTYSGLIAAIFSAVASHHGKSTWGYKRASFATEAPFVEELFPDARFVHIIRDARDVALSMRAASESLLERSWHFGAVDWTAHIHAGRALGATLGPGRYLEVRYERFMSEPAAVLAEILIFSCGDSDDSSRRIARIRDEIGTLVKPRNTEKWRHAVPPNALRAIERVAGGTLAELGYQVLYPDVVGQPIGALEMGWLQVDRLFNTLVRTQPSSIVRYRLAVLAGKLKGVLGSRR